MTNATALLNKAARIMEERGEQYDSPEGERSMGRAVIAFNAITGCDLTESEGWLLLQLLKDVRDRQRTEPHQDSLEDCIAYAALKAEAVEPYKLFTSNVMKQFLTDVITASGLLSYGKTDKGLAKRINDRAIIVSNAIFDLSAKEAL